MVNIGNNNTRNNRLPDFNSDVEDMRFDRMDGDVDVDGSPE